MTRTIRRTDTLQPAGHWWHRFKLSTQKFAVAMSLLAFGLGFTYVWMTNQTAAVGFAIEELQFQLEQLRDNNEQLELQTADIRALGSVATTTQQLELEPTTEFSVLEPTGSVAVQR